MSHQDCCRELLTSSEVGHVTICPDCGQIHLTLQYLTLRFEAEAFRALAGMVNQAQRCMDRAAATDAGKTPVSMSGGLH